MGTYTSFLEDKSCNLIDEDDYLEALKKADILFRTFDKVLDVLITEHGYKGGMDNADEKVRFITDKLKKAGVPIPRNMKKWYTEHKRVERRTAFQICFAFELNVDEVEDFFRRACLSRGFDCHMVEEVVFSFAFRKELSYQEALDILSKVEIVKPDRMTKEDIIYTDLIVDEINEIESAEELIVYLNENAGKFGYNNATACDAIRTIWESISRQDGIAMREKRRLYIAFDKDEEEAGPEKKRKERKRADDSMWEIYLQILGLSGNYSAGYYKDRSLKTILKGNALLHPLAEESFPDRVGLNKILAGEHLSYEKVRKILILLAFYKFWAERALGNHSYEAGYEDADRCMAVMNDNLTDAGYPALYPGNPYDFIFLTAIHSECPLITFRDFMQELFFEKKPLDS